MTPAEGSAEELAKATTRKIFDSALLGEPFLQEEVDKVETLIKGTIESAVKKAVGKKEYELQTAMMNIETANKKLLEKDAEIERLKGKVQFAKECDELAGKDLANMAADLEKAKAEIRELTGSLFVRQEKLDELWAEIERLKEAGSPKDGEVVANCSKCLRDYVCRVDVADHPCPNCYIGDLRARVSGLGIALSEATAKLSRGGRFHEAGCPAIADDESDAVLYDFQECACLAKKVARLEKDLAEAKGEAEKLENRAAMWHHMFDEMCVEFYVCPPCRNNDCANHFTGNGRCHCGPCLSNEFATLQAANDEMRKALVMVHDVLLKCSRTSTAKAIRDLLDKQATSPSPAFLAERIEKERANALEEALIVARTAGVVDSGFGTRDRIVNEIKRLLPALRREIEGEKPTSSVSEGDRRNEGTDTRSEPRSQI